MSEQKITTGTLFSSAHGVLCNLKLHCDVHIPGSSWVGLLVEGRSGGPWDEAPVGDITTADSPFTVP